MCCFDCTSQMSCLRVISCIALLSGDAGVEQLSSLQHLDLAYNLLLEHSQLAPLSLLHCLDTVRKCGHTRLPVQHSVDLLITLNLV